MDATPLETVQVEASVFQKEQIINGKDAGGHSAGGGTELDHNGPKHLDQFRGNVSNGESAFSVGFMIIVDIVYSSRVMRYRYVLRYHWIYISMKWA